MGRNHVPARVRLVGAAADLDPGATDLAIAGVYRAPRPRRNGKLKIQEAELGQLTIKVSKHFKQKLQAYIATVEESAGAYLERLARRDLEDKVVRLVASWAPSGPADGPPALPFPAPDPAEQGGG